METISQTRLKFNSKAYLLLAKPGIIMGNAITTAGGFALASKGTFDFGLFLSALMGLSLIIASACVFNNYIDRFADQKMKRTQNRPLVTGVISSKRAIVFAIFLCLAGTLILFQFVNLLSVAIAITGFSVYVFCYSFIKYHSTHATLIGSIAGSVPPVLGYCAVTNDFDLGAILLFVIIALWQMPHFYAIALFRMKEYKAASIPVLPIAKGIPATKIQMLVYVIAFTLAALLLTVFDYTGIAYAVTVGILGVMWTLLAIQGFKAKDDVKWARKMFFFSLVVVTVLCAVIPFSIA